MLTAPDSTRAWATEQSSATQRQLILAAMRLMAEQGIDGVSLRQVNAAAGAKNSSAAHYHFKNKLGLVAAIVETLARDVAAVRTPLMEKLRTRCKSERLSARDIIETAYGPFMALIFHPEYGLTGIRFLSRLIVDTGPELRVIANRFTAPLAEEVFELLSNALPEMPPNVLKMRILCSITSLINGMSDMLALESSPFGDLSTPGSLEAANHFLEYMAAGISAPPSVMSEESQAMAREIISLLRGSGASEPRARVEA